MKEGAILTKRIKNANAPMIFGEKEAKVFKEATDCHICEKPLEDDINGRMDHLSNMKEWLEINELDIRKVPTEKELDKVLNEYEDVKYTWKDNPVLKVTKKVKGKVQIQMKDETKTVNLSELKKTEEYQKLFDANNALKNYIKKNDCRVVRDHCHFTGEFRGAAHNHCNRQFRKIYNIPVFMHNLKGYDGHIVFENLAKLKLNKAPKVIAKSLESFM